MYFLFSKDQVYLTWTGHQTLILSFGEENIGCYRGLCASVSLIVSFIYLFLFLSVLCNFFFSYLYRLDVLFFI